MKIEEPGTIRAAAEDSAFQYLGSSEHAYHDRLVHFSAFLAGYENAQTRVKELEGENNGLFQQLGQTGCDLENARAENAKLRKVVCMARDLERCCPEGPGAEYNVAIRNFYEALALVGSSKE